jgi:hypothetical protein
MNNYIIEYIYTDNKFTKLEETNINSLRMEHGDNFISSEMDKYIHIIPDDYKPTIGIEKAIEIFQEYMVSEGKTIDEDRTDHMRVLFFSFKDDIRGFRYSFSDTGVCIDAETGEIFDDPFEQEDIGSFNSFDVHGQIETTGIKEDENGNKEEIITDTFLIEYVYTDNTFMELKETNINPLKIGNDSFTLLQYAQSFDVVPDDYKPTIDLEKAIEIFQESIDSSEFINSGNTCEQILFYSPKILFSLFGGEMRGFRYVFVNNATSINAETGKVYKDESGRSDDHNKRDGE